MNIFFQCPQLKPLGQGSCKELWRQSSIFEVDAKEYLWRSGQEVDSVYVLLEGAVYFSEIDVNGKETVFYPGYPVSLIGESEVFLGRSCYSNYARAMSKSRIAKFDKGLLLERLESDSSYARWWLTQMTERVQVIKQLCMATTTNSLESRIIRALIAGYQHGKCESGDRVFLYTQDIFANMLGASRRVVNKALQDLAGKGYIELQYGRIVLNDALFKLI